MFIIKAQDSYIRNFDLGFDKEKLVIINNTARIEEHKEGVESEILSLPGVKSISFSDCFPVNGATVTNEVNWEGKDPAKKLHFWCLNTDFGFANTVSLKITRGRYFDRSFISDSSCYVINDIAANVMDYADPVGHQIELDGRKGTIIGVFRDYHTIDLSGPFTPTIITLYKGNSKYLLIKYSESDYKELKDKIGELLKRYDPEIEYNPLTFADMRKRTELTTTSNLIGVAFIIAILLACMGLSGLASFNAESRTKEIGIRKVNGGTTASVIRLLGRNYTKWIIIASLFALPVVFLLGNVFLRRFNFRISFPLWTLIAGPALSYLIAVSAVILQSWKAASKNPVEALRYE
jgi:ABC-type antimicrobial peptide transport system permease subunit